MKFGGHLGSLLHHDQTSVIGEVASIGYQVVAVRPRPALLDPASDAFSKQILQLGEAARQSGVGVVVDADAMFMPDPHLCDSRSLADPSKARQAIEWLKVWINAAEDLNAKWITFRSGVSEDDVHAEEHLELLASHLNELVAHARGRDVHLALRPQHGDAIATVAQFERLAQWLIDPDPIRLAADIGEMLLGHEIPLGDRLARNIDSLSCVYLCDRTTGVACDQRFGQGHVAISRIVQTLQESGFDGPAIVRVDGHSECGIDLLREAWAIVKV